ncbi:MAG: hypothetical protein D8B37_02880 [Candidatus Saccharimonas sp.]|nr:MAG: hypothetical protein D8B37_02880 [Candidatus Saccharimonas sp.]
MSTEVLQRRSDSDSDSDISTISPEVLQLQKRVKSLRVPEIPRDFSKGKTRKGLKKALQGIESCSVKEELESYEYQLADALNCRRELIDEIFKTEKYLRNISSGQYEKIYKKLKDLETIQEVLNYADKEVIPSLQQVIKALSIAENDDHRQIRKVQKTKHTDKKHGRRINTRHDQHYKRSREIERAKKQATRIAFA